MNNQRCLQCFFTVLLIFLASTAGAQGYWTQCGVGEGMANPIGGATDTGGNMHFYRWSDAEPYNHNGSMVQLATDFNVAGSVSGGESLDKTDGYYYLSMSIPIPATAAISQDNGYYTLIQFSYAIGTSDPGVLGATGINSDFMQVDLLGDIICGNIINEATNNEGVIQYPYTDYAGKSTGVYIKIPDSFEGQKLYVYCDAQTYDPDGRVVQHGWAEDEFLLLGSLEATPTSTPTATNTPTNTPTSTYTSTPTQTFTPPPTPTPSASNTFTPSPTRTSTPTRTPTRTPTSTRTPTNTPTSTNTPTATPTAIAGTLDIAIVSINCPTEIRIPGWSLISVTLRNQGTIASSTGFVLSASNTLDSLVYITTTVPHGVPAVGDEVTFSGWLTSGGCEEGTRTIRAAFDFADADLTNNYLSKDILFLPINTPTPTSTSTPTSTETPTPTVTSTSTPTATETSTPTLTPTNTLTPTFTNTPTSTPTIAPTAITVVDADLELNVSEGGARAGAFHGHILGATYEFSGLPPTSGFSLQDIVYGFRRGDIIVVDDPVGLYWLYDRAGVRRWKPIGDATSAQMVENSTRITILEASASIFSVSFPLYALLTHVHSASDITSGALHPARGGLGRDVSALSGLLKISGGSVTAVADNSGNWDTAYGWGNHATRGYITDPNDSVSGAELDAELFDAASGILIKTASGIFSTTINNASNWDTAYTDRMKWDGGSTGLVAATGRTSLGLGSAALRAAEDTLTNGENLPDGAAITAYVTGLGYITTISFDTSAELRAILTDEKGNSSAIFDNPATFSAAVMTATTSLVVGSGSGVSGMELTVNGEERVTTQLSVGDFSWNSVLGTKAANTPTLHLLDGRSTTNANGWSAQLVIQGASNPNQTAPLMYLYNYPSSPQNGLQIEQYGSGNMLNLNAYGTGKAIYIYANSAGKGLDIADIGASSGGSGRILEQRSGTEAYLQISQGNAASDQFVLKSDGTVWFNHGGNLSYGVQQYFASSALPAYQHKISSSHSSSSGAANNLLFSLNNGTANTYVNTLNLTGDGRIGVDLSDLPDYTVEAGGDIRSNGALRAQELILDVTSVHPSTAGAIRIYMP